jgi:hypothetical protein
METRIIINTAATFKIIFFVRRRHLKRKNAEIRQHKIKNQKACLGFFRRGGKNRKNSDISLSESWKVLKM